MNPSDSTARGDEATDSNDAEQARRTGDRRRTLLPVSEERRQTDRRQKPGMSALIKALLGRR